MKTGTLKESYKKRRNKENMETKKGLEKLNCGLFLMAEDQEEQQRLRKEGTGNLELELVIRQTKLVKEMYSPNRLFFSKFWQ